MLVLFYLVTPLRTDDLVTGHLHGTTLCTMFCLKNFPFIHFASFYFVMLCGMIKYFKL